LATKVGIIEAPMLDRRNGARDALAMSDARGALKSDRIRVVNRDLRRIS
jgi:hypothetical protein